MGFCKRRFSMEYTIKNVSKFSDGEIQWSDEIVWRNLIWKLKISKKFDGFLGVSLYCSQTSNTWIKDCKISAFVNCKIVSDNGKTHDEYEHFNMEPPTKMERPIVDIQKFLKWDEMEKHFLTVDSAKILALVDMFEIKENTIFFCGKFKILHTFKYLARFEENETQFSDLKENSGISWRICVIKEDGYFGFYLQYDSNPNTSLLWKVITRCKLRIQSKENYKFFNLGELKFSRPTMLGNSKLIKWEDLISNYLVNDSVTIEAELNVTDARPDEDNSKTKKFVLSKQFSDASRIEEGESRFSAFEKRFNIPWKIELKRVLGFLEIHLHCGIKIATFDYIYTKIETDCWFNLVSTNGKSLMRQMSAEFLDDTNMRSLNNVIRWDDMMTDFVINDSFIIEGHIEILKITEEMIFGPNWMMHRKPIFYERCFYITCKVNNVSRFEDGEKQWGNTELRYDIPWRIQAKRTVDFLEMYIFCDGDGNGLDQLIQTEVTFNLVSTNGNNYKRTSELNFVKPGGQGIGEFIKWNDMIEYFLNPLEDNLIVEAHVKIYMVEEFSRIIPQNKRSFLMSHTVRDVSNAEEGDVIICVSEEWHDVQWSMSMKYINGFVELLLSCNKELNQNESWSIEARFQLILVGANGKRLIDYFEHTFEKPDSIGDSKVIRWEDMLEKYVVDGNVTVEARVNFTLLIEPQPEYSFIISHTIKNLSNVHEGEFYFSKTEKHCDAPWRISLKKEETCILVYLHCDKLLFNNEHWSIQVEVQLVLVSETGRTLNDKVTHIFNEPEGIHWTKRLVWEDMERDYMVEDSVKIEARVKIVEPVEIDDEEAIGIIDNFME